MIDIVRIWCNCGFYIVWSSEGLNCLGVFSVCSRFKCVEFDCFLIDYGVIGVCCIRG